MVTHMHACIVENKQEDMLAVMYTGSSTVLYVRVVCGRSRSVGEMCSFKEQRNVLMGILLFLRFSFSYCYCYVLSCTLPLVQPKILSPLITTVDVQ